MSLVVRRPSPARTSKEDFCLTPPEEVRAQRLRLFLFLGVVAICALGIALYFGAPRLGRATKAWQSRRLAREAFALIEQKQWSETGQSTTETSEHDAVLGERCPTGNLPRFYADRSSLLTAHAH